ncbi:uncharacterized protein (DUF1697 family) [Chitinophaga skermanii]|uniref:Uncharacterized protein (DUF1697 family) n=1 Tax=Chitinophaga skermanii TaxID=331697 RepID=A0A327QRY9_9BACT|nr:DUF1697 domain-containing protein [Chitinophaga skermanii]RAJ06665.1 uncharacterized protein (DUF1697 family) [Chitinophaga skermanii]
MKTQAAKTYKYIAFLRAINVGGRTVKMDALKQLFVDMGCFHIITYIQSGNLIFDTTEKNAAVLTKKIETYLLAQLGYEVITVLKQPAELASIINQHPFLDINNETHTQYVMLLNTMPNAAQINSVMEKSTDIDTYKIIGDVVHIRCHKAPGIKNLFSNMALEKLMKIGGTTRNWNTMNKLLALAQ